MKTISFNTQTEIAPAQLELFLTRVFGIHNFTWVEDFYSYLVNDGEVDNGKTYISLQKLGEGFNCCYEVFLRITEEPPLKKQMEILSRLSQETGVEIICSDDEIDPYSWIFIEPNGQCSTVDTESDDLVLRGFYNFPFGGFRTIKPLNASDVNVLKRLVSVVYPDFQLDYINEHSPNNGEFDKAKNDFEKLKPFNHHYVVIPTGKNTWLDKEEKSARFIEVMHAFHNKTQKPVCVFPRNYSEIKNIEWGSDSEEHCIVITDASEEKIIYKQRRKTWKV